MTEPPTTRMVFRWYRIVLFIAFVVAIIAWGFMAFGGQIPHLDLLRWSAVTLAIFGLFLHPW